MASVELRGLAKRFAGKPALDGIDLSLQEGEFCVLAGPPAAGKTTLLRAIAGLETADAGSVEIDGAAVDGHLPGERDVAFVFQTDALFPRMSAFENIAFGLQARRLPRADVAAAVEKYAGLAGIRDCLALPAARLSERERRLVGIGRALVRTPSIRLIDDPLAGLGSAERSALGAEIKRLHAALPATTVFATREPDEAMALGDRVVLIRDGRLEQDGTPLDLFERPATRFAAGFFGSPPMNFLPGTLTHTEAGSAIRLGDGPLVPLPPGRLAKTLEEGRALVLGLRPEHMSRALRASPADGTFRFDAAIELLRPAGARTYATFRIGTVAVVAELQAHDATAAGDRLPIDVNLKRASIFDAASGKAI